jgi:hypothetical protein
MRKHALAGGWEDTHVDYRIFYPSFFKSLRYLERHLGWLGLGAQYRLTARRSA